ncbi:nicotinate (nicotinamide) nucleotide adenylyltransferase [Candidatus Marinimicrobia bacterium MT.SAG.2]|nr:nicotinate (nicotinamide) nucleotide adenylyltransferase [Candidatus Marinimicrobia bacterium MT.SAG.2]
MRLGIFGGTFDPPHNGHLRLAQFVFEKKSLDKLIFVTAFITPYSDKTSSVSFENRFRMTQLMIENSADFEASDVEGVRGGDSFTIDTVRQFKELYSLEADQLFLIIGADSLMRFDEWKTPEAILNECSVCVLDRAEVKQEKMDKLFIDSVEFLDNELMAESSSDIRNRIRENKGVDEFLDSKVINYIYDKKLYIN